MARQTDAELALAEERGRIAAATEARAKAVTFDAKTRKLAIELKNGVVALIPVDLVQELCTAPDRTVANVLIEGSGYGLHWPDIDLDMSVPGLVAGVFGTRSHMARLAGQTRSKAKAAAARKNGAKGGRPRKSRKLATAAKRRSA